MSYLRHSLPDITSCMRPCLMGVHVLQEDMFYDRTCFAGGFLFNGKHVKSYDISIERAFLTGAHTWYSYLSVFKNRPDLAVSLFADRIGIAPSMLAERQSWYNSIFTCRPIRYISHCDNNQTSSNILLLSIHT